MEKSFAAAMSETFRLPGQQLRSFAQELKSLSPADKAWYYAELTKAGIACTPPPVAA